MAKKNNTKKSEEKVEKKSEPKTKKKQMVELTFRPLFSAATTFTAYLQKKVTKVHNGNEMMVDVPMIDGLPGIFTLNAGEVITVTKEQFDELSKLGLVESEAQVAKRKAIIKGLENQHPDNLTYDMMATDKDFNIKPREIEKVYNDKLIIVE